MTAIAQAQDADAALVERLHEEAEAFGGSPDEDDDGNVLAGLFNQAADRIEALTRLSVTTPDTTVLVERAKALVAKLDECEPHIKNAAVFMHVHGMNYTGPQYGEALEAFRQALASTANPTGAPE